MSMFGYHFLPYPYLGTNIDFWMQKIWSKYCFKSGHPLPPWTQLLAHLTLSLWEMNLLTHCKLCRSRSEGTWRSPLIRVCTVCHKEKKIRQLSYEIEMIKYPFAFKCLCLVTISLLFGRSWNEYKHLNAKRWSIHCLTFKNGPKKP